MRKRDFEFNSRGNRPTANLCETNVLYQTAVGSRREASCLKYVIEEREFEQQGEHSPSPCRYLKCYLYGSRAQRTNMAKGWLHGLMRKPSSLKLNIESTVTNSVNCRITHSKDNDIKMITLLQNP
jgi:hypothetical protein